MSVFTDHSHISTLVQTPVPEQVQVPVPEQVVIHCSNRNTKIINLPSRSNQDRGAQITTLTEGGIVTITCVADGHGIQGQKFADVCINIFQASVPESDWNEDDLTDVLKLLVSKIEEECISTLSQCYGGSTLSIYVDRESRDTWVTNLADSDVTIFDTDTQTYEVLSKDHSPSNIDEFERIMESRPETIFEYDKRIKQGPTIPIYKQVDEKWTKPVIVSTNIYAKNVEGQIATYIGNGNNDKLAMTRSIGDFNFKRNYGLISEPSISKYPPLTENQVVVIATDGLWDSWKYTQLLEYLSRDDYSDISEKHGVLSRSLFGNSVDDTFAYIISGKP